MYSLNDLVLTKGSASTPLFSSTAERIEFFADITCESFDIEYRYFAYDADGNEKQVGAGVAVFSGKFFHIKDDFDPVFFGVYEGAESFKVEFFSRSGAEFAVVDFGLNERSHERYMETEEESEGRIYDIPKRVLFVGNSLLLGMFNKYGMCATAPDKDYFHYVCEHIKAVSPDCVFDRLHGAVFEGLASPDDFEETFYKADNVYTQRPAADSFRDEPDLIFIQIGDNVNSEEKEAIFKNTAFLLIDEIKKLCPKARIIWIYGWYNFDRTHETLMELKKKYDIDTVNIQFFMLPKNQAKRGQLSVGPDGEPQQVKATWITHPGDVGFKEIADKIIKMLKFKQKNNLL